MFICIRPRKGCEMIIIKDYPDAQYYVYPSP